MKKRLLAAIMSLCMIVSLLPVSAFAVEDPGTPADTVDSVSTAENSPVQITKTVSAPDDSGNYTLKLESYVTGKVTSTAPTPMDIALVLDVSGSMDEEFSRVETSEYEKVWESNWLIATNINRGNYYYSPDATNFYPITGVTLREEGRVIKTYYYTYTYTVDGTPHQTEEFEGALYTPDQIYQLSIETTPISKLNALKNAVNSFIDATAEQNAQITEPADKNRISIVKFAGEEVSLIGNDMSYEENYTQIVKNLTVVDENGKNSLKDAVNALQHGGATSADYGLSRAEAALRNNGEGRNKVVIFFTDGEPNRFSGFDSDVAVNAVNKAKTMKGNGVTIYTIGVMQGADPSDIEEDINKYMNAVSSNYPSATAKINKGRFSVDFGGDFNNAGYYKAASNAGDLNNIFQDISESLTPSVDANETSVLKDTVTDAFDLVLDKDSKLKDVTVEKLDNTATGWVKDEEFDSTKVTVTYDGNTVNITGFDYSANAVGMKDDQPQGSKLVVSFKIHPSADYIWQGGKQICFTNSTDSGKLAGLYVNKGQTAIDRGTLFDSPSVAITAYQVTYNWGEALTGPLYDADGASVTLTLPTDNKCYVAGQTYTVDSTYGQGYTVYTHDEYGNVNGQ